MTARAMNCRQLVRLVTEYLEGALPADDASRFDAHILRCGGCAEFLDQMRRTIALTGALREDDVTPPARESLLAAFRDWRAGAP